MIRGESDQNDWKMEWQKIKDRMTIGQNDQEQNDQRSNKKLFNMKGPKR